MLPELKVQVPPVPPAPVPLRPTAVRAKPEGPKFCNKAFQCKECSQNFDTEHALSLHVKYIHRSKED
eukprot:s599_g4.t1